MRISATVRLRFMLVVMNEIRIVWVKVQGCGLGGSHKHANTNMCVELPLSESVFVSR